MITKLHSTGNIFADTYQLRNGSTSRGPYDIRGLVGLLDSEKARDITVHPKIAQEAEAYREHCDERKAIW